MTHNYAPHNSVTSQFAQQNKIAQLHKQIQSIVEGRCKTYHSFFWKYADNPYVFFSKEEKERMSELTTLICLIKWIESDKNAVQTIGSFATQKYISKHEQKPYSKHNIEQTLQADVINGLRRAEAAYRKNIALENSQAKEEGFTYKRAGYYSEYDFISLRFIDVYREGYLQLYKLLYYNKEIFKVITNTDNSGGLSSAYEAHDKLISDIVDLSKDDEKSKEFVIACLQFYKYECSYRFSLAGNVAKYLLNNDCDVSGLKYDKCKYLLYRFSLCCNNNQSMCVPTWLARDYTDMIKIIFEEELREVDECKIIAYRAITTQAYMVFKSEGGFKSLGCWTNEDFMHAKNFLIENYGILKILQPLNLSEYALTTDATSLWKYIRLLYSEQGIIDMESIEEVRSKFHDKRKPKKRKKRHKK